MYSYPSGMYIHLNSNFIFTPEQSYLYPKPSSLYAAAANSVNPSCRPNQKLQRIRRPRTRQILPSNQDLSIYGNNNLIIEAFSAVNNNNNLDQLEDNLEF